MVMKCGHDGGTKNNRTKDGELRVTHERGENDQVTHQAGGDVLQRGEAGSGSWSVRHRWQPSGGHAGDEQQSGGDDEMAREPVAAVEQTAGGAGGEVHRGEDEEGSASTGRDGYKPHEQRRQGQGI